MAKNIQNKNLLRLWCILVAAFAAMFIVFAVLTFVEPVRSLIIHMAEVHVVHRALTAVKWHERFVKWGIKGMVLAASFIVFLIAVRMMVRVLHFVPSSKGVRLFVLPVGRFKQDCKILAVLFCALFAVRIYYMTQKSGLHVDEGLSVILSSYGHYGWGRDFGEGNTYTGAEVKQMMFCNDLSLKSTPRTIARLWWDNRDSPHTNFYYSLLRIFLTGMTGGGVKDIVRHAGPLNLLLFALSFTFAYMLLVLLFSGKDESYAVFCTLAIMFLNVGSISNTIFFRPYQLQECMTLLFALVIVRVCQAVCSEDASSLITVKNLVTLSVVSALFLLSAYSSIIFFAITGLSLVVMALRKKRRDAAAFLCFVAFFTFAVAVCLYPHYFKGFFVSRGREAIEHMSSLSFDTMVLKPLKFYAVQITSRLFYVPVIAVSLIAATIAVWQCKTQGHKDVQDAINMDATRTFPCIFNIIAALLWQAAIAVLMPFNDVRHLYASFPMVCLVLPMIAAWCSGILRRVYLPSLVLIYALTLPLSLILPASQYKMQVEYLYKGETDKYECLADDKVTVVFAQYNGANIWEYATIVPLFNDNQKYTFLKVPDSAAGVENFIASVPYNDFFLLTMIPGDDPSQNVPFDLTLFHHAGYWYEKHICTSLLPTYCALER